MPGPAWVGPTPDGMPAEQPVLTIAHLSDTHLTAAGLRYNGLDADLALHRAVGVLNRARAAGRGPDVIVASGDLTDSGDPDAYRRVAAALGSLAPHVVYATGNHDVRSAFHRHLLGGAVAERPDPVMQVHRLPGIRVMVLDSTVVGAGHGRLEPSHLAELDRELATPYPGGSVVVLHHAPIPPPSPLLTYFALERASRSALGGVLAGSDTRLVLAGHHHLAGAGMLAGIPVAVAGSTAVRTDPLAPAGRERVVAAGSFNLVRLYPDTLTVSVIPLDEALLDETGQLAVAFDLSPEECAAVVAAHPISGASI